MRFPGFLKLRGPDKTIVLPQRIYDKMLAYAKASKGEVSGWGKTEETEDEFGDKVITVTELRLFKQVVMSVHTSLDGEALTKFYIEMATTGNEDMTKWNLWWHSHNDMPVFFSSQDDAAIAKLNSKNLYSICINKMGMVTARADQKKQSQEVPISIEHNVDPEILKSCAEEVKLKVKFEETTFRVRTDPELTKAVKDYIARFKAGRDRGWEKGWRGTHVDL